MKAIVTPALLVRAVPYGESDVIATLFTEGEGKLGVMVRGGRASSKRVGGALEPFHTIEARIDDRGGDLATLREARIVRVRAGLAGELETMDAAGAALRWIRHACPPRTREPEAWVSLVALLDALDATARARAEGAPATDARVVLAGFALRLLADLGYALELDHCISCGKACPPDRAARIDPARGGLLCSTCGGGAVLLRAALRAKALAAQRAPRDDGADAPCGATGDGDPPPMSPPEADELLALADAAMAAHAGFDR